MTGLLTADLRARIGDSVTYTAPEPLSRASIRYFALAVGDDNPLYTDDAYAREHGLPGVVAPPTLLCETNQPMRERHDDGLLHHSWGIDIPNTRQVRGGNAYTFGRYARPDDVVSVTWTLKDATERVNGRGQQMLVVTSEATYTGTDGDLIATNVETMIFISLDRAA